MLVASKTLDTFRAVSKRPNNSPSDPIPIIFDDLDLYLEYLDGPEDCLRELVEKLVNLKSLDISG